MDGVVVCLHLSLWCHVGKSGFLRCYGSKKSILIKLNWKHATRPRSSFVKERCAHTKVCCNDMVKGLLLQENFLFYLSGSRDESEFRVGESFIWSESKNIVGRIKGQVKFGFIHLKVQCTMKKCLVTSGRRRPLICYTARLKGFCFLFRSFAMNLELLANQTDSNISNVWICLVVNSVTNGEAVCSWQLLNVLWCLWCSRSTVRRQHQPERSLPSWVLHRSVP